MKTRVTFGAIAVTLMTFGCASHKSGGPQSDSNQLHPTVVAAESAKAPPVTADTRFATGQLAESAQNTDAAIKQYQEALKLDANHQPSLYRLGVIYAQQKKFDQAIAIWQRYVKATKGSASSYSDLAFCYELAGRNSDAETAYQAGIRQDFKNVPCRTNYGLMMARHGHLQEAVRIWQPVLKDAEIHYNLASVYEIDGRKLEAKSEYQKAIELDPNLTDAKNRMAQLDLE